MVFCLLCETIDERTRVRYRVRALVGQPSPDSPFVPVRLLQIEELGSFVPRIPNDRLDTITEDFQRVTSRLPALPSAIRIRAPLYVSNRSLRQQFQPGQLLTAIVDHLRLAKEQ